MGSPRRIPIYSFPFFRQEGVNDCAIACLRMIARYYETDLDLTLEQRRHLVTPRGVSMLALIEKAESLGLTCTPLRGRFDEFLAEADLPCIAYWKDHHFVVVFGIDARWIHVADPASGIKTISHEAFKQGWLNEDGDEGMIITIAG